MSRLTLSAALLVVLLSPTTLLAAAPRAAHIHRHYHARLIGPGIVGPNWDLYGGAPAPVYDGSYAPLGGGDLYGRESGGINSMSNDFGTSGVLGHTNGMPVTGH